MFNWSLVFAVSVAVFTALSIQTNFWQQMGPDMNLTFNQLNNAQSSNLAGLAAGCIFFIPFTKKYGRRLTYIISTMVMAGISFWSARMQTEAELHLTNLIYGLAGATNETISQMTIADLFFVHQRGRINALYLTAVMVASFLTPMVAGVQAQNQGWRASYITLGISLALLSVIFIFGYEETKYVPVLEGVGSQQAHSSSAAAVPDEGGDMPKSSSIAKANLAVTPSWLQTPSEPIPMNTYKERMRLLTPTNESLRDLFVFPLRVIWLPHVLFTATQYAAGIIWLTVLATMTSRLFSEPPYLFNTAQLGYMGLGPFVGNLLGSFYAGVTSDWAVTHMSKRKGGWYHPEYRLYPLILPAFCQAGGLVTFGITADKGMHWIYPSIGGALFAFGLGAMGDITFTFVIDTYRPLTAEAFVGIAFFRNAAGIGIPFALDSWITGMGVSNMFIMIGVISFVVSMLCVPMIIWGRKMRVALAPRYYRLLEKQATINMY
ncbi:hypothetical protein ACJ41O_005557 [Fusarium nematophilum]